MGYEMPLQSDKIGLSAKATAAKQLTKLGAKQNSRQVFFETVEDEELQWRQGRVTILLLCIYGLE